MWIPYKCTKFTMYTAVSYIYMYIFYINSPLLIYTSKRPTIVFSNIDFSGCTESDLQMANDWKKVL